MCYSNIYTMNEEVKTQIYELTFWVRKDLDAFKIIHEDIKNKLAKHDGEILFIEEPRIKNLAFPIKKEFKGIFCVIKIKLPVEKLRDFENWMKLKIEILRFLTAKPLIEKMAIKKSMRRGAIRAKPIAVPEIAKEASEPKEAVIYAGTTKESAPDTELTIEAIDEKLKEILQQ